jgi:hypothetical protein
MLRTCILLSCSFFSFAVHADNPVPVNVFGATASNVINHAPTNVSAYVPASADKPVSANPLGYIPANPLGYIPANKVSYAPTSAVKPVSANAANYVPASVSSSIPDNVENSVWLLIDTKSHKIEVKKGAFTIETLDGIAIGRKGAGIKSHRGDNITPHGEYRIGWIGEKSQFRKFFGLTYPSVQDAEIGLKHGVISQDDYYNIKVAQELNQIPPQDTPLGGQIGIHGLGSGDIRVHQVFDWTHGCIALTNTQIDHLSQWLDTGTVVKIK